MSTFFSIYMFGNILCGKVQEESVFLQWIKDTDYAQLVKSLSKKRTRGLEICGRIALRTQLCKSSLDVILVLWLQLLA